MTFLQQQKWARIVFPHPPYQQFTYEVPDKFFDLLKLGHRVLVPLGRRNVTGFVVDFLPVPDIATPRCIEDIMEPDPMLSEEMLNLTRWIAGYYLSSWGETIRTALPPGIHRKTQLIIRLPDDPPQTIPSLSLLQEEILAEVQKNQKLTLQTLENRLNKTGLRYHLSKLEKYHLIKTGYVLENPKVRIKKEKWIKPVKIPEKEDLVQLQKRAPTQAEVLKKLTGLKKEVRKDSLQAGPSILRGLENKGWISVFEREVLRHPESFAQSESPEKLVLTDEQKTVLFGIENELQKETFHTFLLFGVSSSGKTLVYIEAIRRVLDRGKTALVLIPEISLTPQAVQRYRSVFGDEVAVLHSRMSTGERYDSWRKMRDGQFKIGLGPRSAVFAPLKNLGLIVVDEEHDTSYKQSDPSPRYHARDVAIVRGQLNNCLVLLGSATPSIESFHNAETGKYTLCKMMKRIDNIPLPNVTLVNKKDDTNKVFSPLLIDNIAKRLKSGEQIILMQNRRGYAPFLRCCECGNIESCTNCDISLTFHQKDRQLLCHYCGFRKHVPDVCVKCGGATLVCHGVGTQRVEEELNNRFPDARIMRMDQDTTRRKGSHDRIILNFEKQKGDILLGTQMVAKGHDFPGVNLVGIISADTGLHFPDFRAGEKTFQLLTQAAGRAGRRDCQGEVVIQTFSPENPILKFACNQDYLNFYRTESEARKELNYPPWGRLILIKFRGSKEKNVEKTAVEFSRLVPSANDFDKLGPVPSPLSKVKGMYRYQLILKGNKATDPAGKKLRHIVKQTVDMFYRQHPIRDVRIGIDVDPVDLM